VETLASSIDHPLARTYLCESAGDYASKYHSACRKIHRHFSRRDMHMHGSYDIFGAEGATSSDKIANGMERAGVFRPSFFR